MRVFGFAGWSGSGKTTLVEGIIPILVGSGHRVAVIKHAHHEFDVDQPRKDSWRHRKAGAAEVLVTSGQRWALMHELRGAPEPTLSAHLARLSPCDLVLVEGFKREPMPKLEVHRRATGKPVLFEGDGNIVAIATDQPLASSLPQFALEDHAGIVDFILRHTGLARPAHPSQT